jgi:hypothetical protein
VGLLADESALEVVASKCVLCFMLVVLRRVLSLYAGMNEVMRTSFAKKSEELWSLWKSDCCSS